MANIKITQERRFQILMDLSESEVRQVADLREARKSLNRMLPNPLPEIPFLEVFADALINTTGIEWDDGEQWNE